MPEIASVSLGICKVVSASNGHIRLCEHIESPAIDIYIRKHAPQITKALKPFVGKRYEIELILREAA